MNHKRYASILLLMAMLAFLNACGGEGAAVDTTAASGSDTTAEVAAVDYSAIPHVNVENEWWVDGSVKDFSIGNLRDMEADFGILPGPRYGEAQKEYYSLGGNPYFMLVPVTSADLDKTGLLMEALAYESVGIIFGNLTYYHPVARDYVCVNITNRLWSGDTDFASYFASNESAISGLIEEAEAAYEANVK